MRTLRWIAIVPAALLGWNVALIAGMALLSFAETFCPPSDMVSGMCMAEWFGYVQAAVFAFGAGLAAVLIVAVAALVAPAHRVRVAWTAYAVGGAVAVYMAWEASAARELATALVSGLATAWIISARERRREHAGT